MDAENGDGCGVGRYRLDRTALPTCRLGVADPFVSAIDGKTVMNANPMLARRRIRVGRSHFRLIPYDQFEGTLRVDGGPSPS